MTDSSSSESLSLIPSPPPVPSPPAELSRPKRLHNLSPTATDRRRWLLSSQGMSPEEISVRTNSKVQSVKDSLIKMGAYFQANSHQVVDARVNELALSKLDKASQMLDEAFEAIRYGSDGKPILDPVTAKPLPDFSTALKAFKAIKDFIEAIRPKGSAVALQVNNNSGNTTIMTGVRSYEERLRAARERNGMRNDDEVPVIQAEEVEADYDESEEEFDEDASDADELEGVPAEGADSKK